MKYRKKPVVIEAFQMTEETRWNNVDWPEWLHLAWNKKPGEEGAFYIAYGNLYLSTLEDPHRVTFDDFIIRGVAGELYPCKPEIFEQTYSALTDDLCGVVEITKKAIMDMGEAAVDLALKDLRERLIAEMRTIYVAEIERRIAPVSWTGDALMKQYGVTEWSPEFEARLAGDGWKLDEMGWVSRGTRLREKRRERYADESRWTDNPDSNGIGG